MCVICNFLNTIFWFATLYWKCKCFRLLESVWSQGSRFSFIIRKNFELSVEVYKIVAEWCLQKWFSRTLLSSCLSILLLVLAIQKSYQSEASLDSYNILKRFHFKLGSISGKFLIRRKVFWTNFLRMKLSISSWGTCEIKTSQRTNTF